MQSKIDPFELVELRMLQRGMVTTSESDWLRAVLGSVAGVICMCFAAYYEVNLYIGLVIPFVPVILSLIWIDQVGRKITANRIIEIKSSTATSK